MRTKGDNSRLVYTTDGGRMCPDCRQPTNRCRCRKQREAIVRGDGRVRVQRQTKGRKGKGVSLVTGLPLADLELKLLAKELKQACGCGGTVKDGIIEIQGDHRDLLVSELTKRGWDARKAGG